MSELSEEEDALLAKLLLNTDLVSEENVAAVRDMQSNLRDQDIKISIVDLLLQRDLLSRSDLNSLRSLVEQETEGGDALMPARFEYPFLTQKEIAERAREEGVISDRTYERMREIQEQLEEQGITKTGGEVLVEQGFVQPEELQIEESSSEEGFMDRIEEGEDLQESFTASQSTSSESREGRGDPSRSRSQVMTELDRYVLEELVERGRIDRAQIPDVVEEARNRETDGPGGSAVQDELRDRGILHPTTEREVLSAAMDRREQAQQWQNRFGNAGPLIVTGVLILCAAGIIYAFYGSGDGQTPSDTAATKATTTETSDEPAATSRRQTAGGEEREPDREEQPESAQQKTENLLTFEANVGRILAEQDCQCVIEFEGASVSQVSGRINEEGVMRISALSAAGAGAYAPGVYALICRINESPGSSLPAVPSAFVYPLEEYGPTDQPHFEKFLNGDLWTFVTVAALPTSESKVEENRENFGRQLRAALQEIVEQWESVKPFLSDREPDHPQLREEFRALYQNTRKLKKRLREFDSYETFYFPAIRERVVKLTDELAGAVARLMIKQREQQDMDIPSDLRRIAGSGAGGSMSAIRSLVETFQALRDRLPGEDESSNPAQFLKPVVREELRKLMQVEAVLRYLSSHSDVQEQAIQQNREMAPYYFLSFYKYALAQISVRSVLLNNTSKFSVFDDETGQSIDELSARMEGRLGQVIRDLVGEFNITLSQKIPESNQFDGNLKQQITETFQRAGVEQAVLEIEQ